MSATKMKMGFVEMDGCLDEWLSLTSNIFFEKSCALLMTQGLMVARDMAFKQLQFFSLRVFVTESGVRRGIPGCVRCNETRVTDPLKHSGV